MNDYFGKRERDVIYTELGIVFLQRGEDGEWYEVGAAPTGEIGEMAAMYFLTWHMPTPEEIEYELNRYDGHQLADIQERLVTGILVCLGYGAVFKKSSERLSRAVNPGNN